MTLPYPSKRFQCFDKFRAYKLIAFAPPPKLVQPVMVDVEADITNLRPLVRSRLLANTLHQSLVLFRSGQQADLQIAPNE